MVGLFLVPWVLLAAPPDAPDPTAITPPKLIKFVEATYPEGRDDPAPAEVVMRLDIDESGRVTQVEVTRSAGEPFDGLATEAARQFEFEPARLGADPISVRILYKYVFTPPEPVKRDPVQNVAGQVYHRWTKQPLAGISVTVLGVSSTTVTDAEGRFEFTDVPPGEHRIELAAEGFVPISLEQRISPDKRVDIRVAMEPVEEDEFGDIDDVGTVRAARVRTEVTETIIQRKEAQQVAGTQGDVVKVVQTLGGVARSAAGASDLVVWGASPSDTRLYVDGIPVPRLFHIGGSRSVLASQMVSSVSLAPGGFGPAYGRAIGGLVRVETLGPTEPGFEAFAAADPIDVGLGARSRMTENTWVSVSGRKSVQGQTLDLVGADEAGGLVPIPDYWDYQAKAHHRLSASDTVEALLFGARDHVNRGIPSVTPDMAFSEDAIASFHRFGVRLSRVNDERVSQTLSPWVGVDRTRTLISIGDDRALDRVRSMRGGFRLSESRRLTGWLLLNWGLDAELSRTTIAREGALSLPAREGDVRVFGQSLGDRVNVDDWATSYAGVGGYVAGTIELAEKRWMIEPGLRVEPSILNGNRVLPVRPTEPEVGYTELRMAIDPRFRITWQPTPRWRIFSAAGRYHQPVAAADLSPIFGNPILKQPLSTHLLAGVSSSVSDTITAEVTGFWVAQSKLSVRSELATPPTAGLLNSNGKGRNYGGQLALKYRHSENLFAWATYSLMRAERTLADGKSWRLFDFDQTHVAQLVASWSHPSGIGLGTRLQLSSGFPRTPVTGAVFNARSGGFDPIFGEQNTVRIPMFAQLSLRAEWARKASWGSYKLWLDVQNVTNRRNAEELIYTSDFSSRDFIAGLPILPLLGVEVNL